jgi:hypothetical protein
MKLNDLDMAHFRAAQMPAVRQPERGWRGVLAAFCRTLMKAWAGLYVLPPRRLPPLI